MSIDTLLFVCGMTMHIGLQYEFNDIKDMFQIKPNIFINLNFFEDIIEELPEFGLFNECCITKIYTKLENIICDFVSCTDSDDICIVFYYDIKNNGLLLLFEINTTIDESILTELVNEKLDNELISKYDQYRSYVIDKIN